jgi:hypothetical protein
MAKVLLYFWFASKRTKTFALLRIFKVYKLGRDFNMNPTCCTLTKLESGCDCESSLDSHILTKKSPETIAQDFF